MSGPSITAVICAYSDERHDDLIRAVASLQRQTRAPLETIVVIDHNPSLWERVRTRYASEAGLVVTENRAGRGLSGARNTAIETAAGEVVAFLDDDAEASPDWLERLAAHYRDERVMGVGGFIEPDWLTGRPRWFPDEFLWVVGCSYRGLPTGVAPIRNLIGANMSIRRDVLRAAGGFDDAFARVGAQPAGIEETELCIRARQLYPEGTFLYEPAARVRHRVPRPRTRFTYYRKICFNEGYAKALMARSLGAKDALSSERSYILRTIPMGMARGVARSVAGREVWGLARAGAMAAGVLLAGLGHVVGMVRRADAVPGAAGAAGSAVAPAAAAHGWSPTGSGDSGDEVVQAPVGLATLDLDRLIGPQWDGRWSTGSPFARVIALVRLHEFPIGLVDVEIGASGLTTDGLVDEIWAQLGPDINRHLERDDLEPVRAVPRAGIVTEARPACLRERAAFLESAPLVTVVVPTRERPARLERCVRSIMASDYPRDRFDVIVVDNAPERPDTHAMVDAMRVEFPSIRYVCEPKAGGASARNRGSRETRSEYVAFADDDVVVDQHWLTELVRGFSEAPGVAVVTGLILPLELETQAQTWLEAYGGFAKGFERQIYDLGAHRPESPLFPYAAGSFGSGANMAFRRSVLEELGGFSTTLGTATPTYSGEDIELLFRAIVRGHTLVYQPTAFVRHLHGRSYRRLRRQVYNYGVGLSAFLVKGLIDQPRLIPDFLIRLPRGLAFAASPDSDKNRNKTRDYPRELTLLELKGMAVGPVAYLRSWWRER